MVLVHIITFPYYRFFQFNTMKPIHRLAACKSRADPPKNLQYLIAHWRARKQAELHFISIAVRLPPLFFSRLPHKGLSRSDVLNVVLFLLSISISVPLDSWLTVLPLSLVRNTCCRRHRFFFMVRGSRRILAIASSVV